MLTFELFIIGYPTAISHSSVFFRETVFLTITIIHDFKLRFTTGSCSSMSKAKSVLSLAQAQVLCVSLVPIKVHPFGSHAPTWSAYSPLSSEYTHNSIIVYQLP